MNRRDWLKRTSLALAGGLVLGDEVMEQYERLTHKRIWALGAVPTMRMWGEVWSLDSIGPLYKIPGTVGANGNLCVNVPSGYLGEGRTLLFVWEDSA